MYKQIKFLLLYLILITLLFIIGACHTDMSTIQPVTPLDEPTGTPTPDSILKSDYSIYLGTLEPPPMEWISTPLPEIFITQTPSPVFHASDLDNDGDNDWILNLPAMYRHSYLGAFVELPLQCLGEKEALCGRCNQTDSCPWMIFIFNQDSGSYTPVYMLDIDKTGRLDDPHVILVEDLTNNGSKEVVILDISCGSACSLLNFVLSLGEDKNWYIAGTIYGMLNFVDQNHDSVKELIAFNHGTCRGKHGVSRARNEIYQWQDGRYILVETIYEFDPFAYFVIHDTYDAIQRGELDVALQFATRVLNDPYEGAKFDCLWLYELEEARIVSYAGIEAMLVYGKQNDIINMESVLTEIMNRYSVAENPFIDAAKMLFGTYQKTGDLLLACQEMEIFLNGYEGRLEMLSEYPYHFGKPFCPFIR
ncbi:MAG: hypothetical protein AAF639_27445 [Chloroflexota bacterium]